VVGLVSTIVAADNVDDWSSVVFVDDGTAFGVFVNLAMAWLVLAYVLDHKCAYLEGIESLQCTVHVFVSTTFSLAPANDLTVTGTLVKGHFNSIGQITSALVYAPEGFFCYIKTVDENHVFLVSGRMLDNVKVVDATVVLRSGSTLGVPVIFAVVAMFSFPTVLLAMVPLDEVVVYGSDGQYRCDGILNLDAAVHWLGFVAREILAVVRDPGRTAPLET